MRILMTGISPPQCGRPTRTGYEHISDLWAKALQAGGCEINHTRIEHDHPLGDYDLVLMGLIPPNSVAARYMFTALDVLSRATRDPNGPAVMFYVDDWRFNQIKAGIKTFNKRPWHFLDAKPRWSEEKQCEVDGSMFSQLWERGWAQTDGRERVIDGGSLLAENWPTTLVPAYNWGDHSKLPSLPTRNRVILDPTAYARKYDIDSIADWQREPEWIMGTFSDQRAWIDTLGLHWPVTYVGTRRSKADQAVKEPELVNSYGGSWGVLGAPYDHSGCGWWRNRLLYAAEAGAIMLTSPEETAGLTGYYMTGRAIEGLSWRDRRDVADHQAKLLWDSVTPAKDLTEQLMALVSHEVKTQKTEAA